VGSLNARSIFKATNPIPTRRGYREQEERRDPDYRYYGMDYLEREKSSATRASENSGATTTASSSYYSHNIVIWIDILCRYPSFMHLSS
jgi:hypothetical protein